MVLQDAMPWKACTIPHLEGHTKTVAEDILASRPLPAQDLGLVPPLLPDGLPGCPGPPERYFELRALTSRLYGVLYWVYRSRFEGA